MSGATLFWDVDTQHDFMDPDGKLAVPGASETVPNLARLTRFAAEHGIPIIASADAHAQQDEEFQEFPQHCVVGTPGQRKIPETSADGMEVADPERLEQQIQAVAEGEIPQLVIEKQKLDVFTEPTPEKVLRALAPERVVVYGVATEYCVLCAVKGIRECGFPVEVVQDAIRAVDQQAGRAAIQQMRQLGATFTDTASALKQTR